MRFLRTKIGTPAEFASAVRTEGAVYIIRAGGTSHLKIGHSRTPRSRIAKLQVGSSVALRPVALIAGPSEVEAHLHGQYRELALRGEWFDDRDGVIVLETMTMTGGHLLGRAIWSFVPAERVIHRDGLWTRVEWRPAALRCASCRATAVGAAA